MSTVIDAVVYAHIDITSEETYLGYQQYGEPNRPVGLDFFFYVLRTKGGAILFDTGFTPAVADRLGQTLQTTVEAALGELEVDPALVETVILSHLHYDHFGNLELFPNAKVILQDREWRFWSSPMAKKAQFAWLFEEAYFANVTQIEREGRLRLINGSVEIAPGISTMLLPGHADGLQGLLVETADRTVALASDSAHYYDEYRNDWPITSVTSVIDMYDSFSKLRELERNDVLVVPGHAVEIRERFDSRPLVGGGTLVRLS